MSALTFTPSCLQTAGTDLRFFSVLSTAAGLLLHALAPFQKSTVMTHHRLNWLGAHGSFRAKCLTVAALTYPCHTSSCSSFTEGTQKVPQVHSRHAPAALHNGSAKLAPLTEADQIKAVGQHGPRAKVSTHLGYLVIHISIVPADEVGGCSTAACVYAQHGYTYSWPGMLRGLVRVFDDVAS
jgi:hypothetical protein